MGTDMDMEAARINMIESQLRPNRVTDTALLTAILATPREKFVPRKYRSMAYADAEIPMSEQKDGRFLTSPMPQARLIQALGISKDDTVLVVGAGTGYACAVIGQLASVVFGLEADPELAEQATSTLNAIDASNVVIVEGGHEEGLPNEAPFDAVLIDGSIETEPGSLLAQLKESGRLTTALGTMPVTRGVIFEVASGSAVKDFIFEASVPSINAFAKKPEFVF